MKEEDKKLLIGALVFVICISLFIIWVVLGERSQERGDPIFGFENSYCNKKQANCLRGIANSTCLEKDMEFRLLSSWDSGKKMDTMFSCKSTINRELEYKDFIFYDHELDLCLCELRRENEK